jgi:hypothetical protein
VRHFSLRATTARSSNDESRKSNMRSGLAIAAIFALVAAQGVGLVLYHPCQLSYYNLLVGGLAGAERLGFEVTYWGDTVREPMLAEAAVLARVEPILFAPNLASYQAPAVEFCSPALTKAGVHLIGWDASQPATMAGCRYAVVYNRRADSAAIAPILARGEIVREYQNQGVWLARLLRLDEQSSPSIPP